MIAHFVGQDAADSGLPCLALPWLGLSLSLSFGLFMPPWPAMRPATTPTTTTMLFFSAAFCQVRSSTSSSALPFQSLSAFCGRRLPAQIIAQQIVNFPAAGKIMQFSVVTSVACCLSITWLAFSLSLYVSLSLSSDLPAVRNYTAATRFLISCRTFSWHFHLPPLSSSSSWLCIYNFWKAWRRGRRRPHLPCPARCSWSANCIFCCVFPTDFELWGFVP